MVFEQYTFLSLGFLIHDEAIDVAQYATQGAHYHADVVT